MTNEYPLPFRDINPDPNRRREEILKQPNPIILVLDGLDDARNLGAIFRLADAARVAGIYGFRMNELDDLNKVVKVSRQTANQLPYQALEDIQEIVALTNQYRPIALEYTNKSIPFKEYGNHEPCMLVIGNERRGVSNELLELCKVSLHIPMLGQNSSMNVSVATGIVVYHLLSNLGKI